MKIKPKTDQTLAIVEQVLAKLQLSITKQQIEDAEDCEVVNGCLILKKEEYTNGFFRERVDFRSVLALTLRVVPSDMFFGATSLESVAMLEAEEIEDGKTQNDASLEEGNDKPTGETGTDQDAKDEEPSDVEQVGAFVGTKITLCYFPKLRKIGHRAFVGCSITNLDDQSFPVLKRVGSHSFLGCPIEMLDLPLLEQVGDRAFCCCKISQICLPNLVWVDDFSFENGLFSSVQLPNLVSIGDGAFCNCRNLKHFSAEKLEQVGSGCFSYCSRLNSIRCELVEEQFICPNKLKECDCLVCNSDVEVSLKRGSIREQNSNVLLDTAMINEALKRFGVDVTAQEAICAEEGKIINGCLILQEQYYRPRVFSLRTDFRSVLGLRLKRVAQFMFYKAENLEAVIMPEVTGMSENDNVSSAFRLTKVFNCYFPKLARVGSFAFSGCPIKSLDCYDFPTLKIIGEGGFQKSHVDSINLPDLLSIGEEGFHDCLITSVDLPNLISLGCRGFSNCKNMVRFEALNVRQIGASCFANCYQLSALRCNVKPKQLVCSEMCEACPVCFNEIEQCIIRGKFGDCKFGVQTQDCEIHEALKRFGLKITLQHVKDAEEGQIIDKCLIINGEHYPQDAFADRSDFQAVVARNLKHVSKSMFSQCKDLTTVVMPEVVGTANGNFRWGAFSNTKVQNCFFPKLVKVGDSAFRCCQFTHLNTEYFPQLQTVGNYGFSGNPILEVNLPTLKQIGSNCFSDCNSLKDFSAGQLQHIGVEGFKNCLVRQLFLPSLESAEQCVFNGCLHLKSFSAPKLLKIGESCFSSCPQLRSINCDLNVKNFICRFDYGFGCDECPVCYQGIDACLNRGKSGEQEEENPTDVQLVEEALREFNVGITVQRALQAEEGEIVNGCLILKEDYYSKEAFKERTDFSSVFALKLRHVSSHMFFESQELSTIILPEAVGVMEAAFRYTKVNFCFCPKLVTIKDGAFQECGIQELTHKNFPMLKTVGRDTFEENPIIEIRLANLASIGESGFANCQLLKVHAPNLTVVGRFAFEQCKNLRQFSAQSLVRIGENCFSFCNKLNFLSCGLGPEQFVCSNYGDNTRSCRCPVCSQKLQLCLQRGRVARQLEVTRKTQLQLLAGLKKLHGCNAGEIRRVNWVETGVCELQNKVDNAVEGGGK